MCFTEDWRYKFTLANHISAFWSSSRWPLATLMSSRRQRSIPLGGRYRQVSLYCFCFLSLQAPEEAVSANRPLCVPAEPWFRFRLLKEKDPRGALRENQWHVDQCQVVWKRSQTISWWVDVYQWQLWLLLNTVSVIFVSTLWESVATGISIEMCCCKLCPFPWKFLGQLAPIYCRFISDTLSYVE